METLTMTKLSRFVLAGYISLFTVSTGFCENTDKESDNPKKLQDSAKAVEYFQNELNFATNPHGVKQVVDGEVKNVRIIDVRDAKTFAKGHIPGAINVPYEKYDSFDGPETEFPGLQKDGFNYVYCYEHLCNLAQKAAKKFASLGYPVKEMVGGFEEWKEHQYPIEK
jgi:rhodanese-related sulfurtransferase